MIAYRDVASRADLEEAWAVRYEVFVVEQKVPIEEEIDALDDAPTTLHALAYADGVLAGTGRVLLDSPGHVHIGRLAVRATHRGCGIGLGLMRHLENWALREHSDHGRVRIVLSSQEHAMAFYRRLGYSPVTGERYLDAGIWHQDMFKDLDTPN